MLKNLLRATILSSLLLGSMAHAVLFTFSDEFSGSGDTCANVTCATLEVLQDGADVDFILTANLASGEYIAGLFGNVDPYQFPGGGGLLGSVNGGAVNNQWILAHSGEDSHKADGDGYFDYEWIFPSAAANRLEGSEIFGWTFEGISLADVTQGISQNGPVGKTGFNFALRVRGLGDNNDGSGWFYSKTTTVPEPGTLALLGFGLLGMGMARRRVRT